MFAQQVSRGPDSEILVEARGPVRLVTLNRPEALNAANESLHGELARLWPDLDADPGTRAIVLTGAGRAFCGGGDLELLDRMTSDTSLRAEIMDEAGSIVRGMTAVRVPIIAAVNGPAVGLGCSLASMSDLVVMDEQAYFADPHVALGLVAGDGGAVIWPLLTSLLHAKEYIFLGDRVPADEALRLGIATRVVPAGTALETALALAERIAALPPQAVRETKALMNDAMHRAVEALLDRALVTETASFDEQSFRDNLARMRNRTR
ncbi:MAG: enoyl-CoA hydratase/isomerase family protein [Acidimicrobiia bacterium]